MKRVHLHSDGARDTVMVNSVGSNDLRTVLRFSKDETVARGAFQKSYLHSDYPVFTLDLLGSLKGIGKNEYSYFQSEFTIDYKLKIPPLGMSKIKLTAGNIVGTVPYPLLKLHEGNGTYILDQSSFSCMEFYEFASDTWATLFWEHNFGGFFLGKIPLIKKMKMREVFTLKAAYGTLSRKNNGIIGNPIPPMLLCFSLPAGHAQQAVCGDGRRSDQYFPHSPCRCRMAYDPPLQGHPCR